MNKYYVYVLKCPFDFKIRYIGCTKNPKLRYRNHRTDNRFTNEYIKDWLCGLRLSGNKPIFQIIYETYSEKNAKSMEKNLIKKFSDQLVNKLHNSSYDY